MKVKVVIPYKDKDTKKVRNTNDVFDCTDDRYKAIKKYVKKIDEPQKAEKSTVKE